MAVNAADVVWLYYMHKIYRGDPVPHPKSRFLDTVEEQEFLKYYAN